MKKSALIISLSILSLNTALAQDVYTWEDENGTLYFSDTPQHSKAKSISVPDFSADAPAPKFEKAQPIPEKVKPEKNKPKPQELSVSLISPLHDATVRSNAGYITIQSELNRKLQVGESLQLMMDGKRYGAPQTQLIWDLKNIDRGTHIFSIQSFRDGKLIASSSIVTVHLQRTSVNQ